MNSSLNNTMSIVSVSTASEWNTSRLVSDGPNFTICPSTLPAFSAPISRTKFEEPASIVHQRQKLQVKEKELLQWEADLTERQQQKLKMKENELLMWEAALAEREKQLSEISVHLSCPRSDRSSDFGHTAATSVLGDSIRTNEKYPIVSRKISDEPSSSRAPSDSHHGSHANAEFESAASSERRESNAEMIKNSGRNMVRFQEPPRIVHRGTGRDIAGPASTEQKIACQPGRISINENKKSGPLVLSSTNRKKACGTAQKRSVTPNFSTTKRSTISFPSQQIIKGALRRSRTAPATTFSGRSRRQTTPKRQLSGNRTKGMPPVPSLSVASLLQKKMQKMSHPMIRTGSIRKERCEESCRRPLSNNTFNQGVSTNAVSQGNSMKGRERRQSLGRPPTPTMARPPTPTMARRRMNTNLKTNMTPRFRSSSIEHKESAQKKVCVATAANLNKLRDESAEAVFSQQPLTTLNMNDNFLGRRGSTHSTKWTSEDGQPKVDSSRSKDCRQSTQTSAQILELTTKAKVQDKVIHDSLAVSWVKMDGSVPNAQPSTVRTSRRGTPTSDKHKKNS